jgi:hypothetical protein
MTERLIVRQTVTAGEIRAADCRKEEDCGLSRRPSSILVTAPPLVARWRQLTLRSAKAAVQMREAFVATQICYVFLAMLDPRS